MSQVLVPGLLLMSICGLIECTPSTRVEFQLRSTKVSWNEASSSCEYRGQRLAHIDSPAKLEAVAFLWANVWDRNTEPYYWIGLHSTDRSHHTYRWSNCDAVGQFSNWDQGVRGYDGHFCVAGNPKQLQTWSSENCSSALAYLCEDASGKPCTFRTWDNTVVDETVCKGRELRANSEAQCQDQCLQLAERNFTECWAYAYRTSQQTCVLYADRNFGAIHEESNWIYQWDWILGKKVCFTGDVVRSPSVSSSVTAASDIPDSLCWINDTTSSVAGKNTLPTPAASVATTSESVNTSTASVTTASESVNTSTASVTTASESVNTSTASVTTASESVNTSTASVTTASESVNTSAASVTTTSESVNTSAASVTMPVGSITTSDLSATTSAESVTTSAESVTASAESVTTSDGSLTTSAESVTTSAESLTTSAESLTTSAESVTTSDGSLAMSGSYERSLSSLCPCECVPEPPIKQTAEELSRLLDAIDIPRRQLSSSRRRLTSAGDDRASAVTCGILAVALVTFTFGGFILSDLLNILQRISK